MVELTRGFCKYLMYKVLWYFKPLTISDTNIWSGPRCVVYMVIPEKGWPKIGSDFFENDAILGFTLYMQFMGYTQYWYV